MKKQIKLTEKQQLVIEFIEALTTFKVSDLQGDLLFPLRRLRNFARQLCKQLLMRYGLNTQQIFKLFDVSYLRNSLNRENISINDKKMLFEAYNFAKNNEKYSCFINDFDVLFTFLKNLKFGTGESMIFEQHKNLDSFSKIKSYAEELFDKGYKIRQIQQRLNVTAPMVPKLLEDKYKERARYIQHELFKGKTKEEIGKKLGLSPSNIGAFLKKYGDTTIPEKPAKQEQKEVQKQIEFKPEPPQKEVQKDVNYTYRSKWICLNDYRLKNDETMINIANIVRNGLDECLNYALIKGFELAKEANKKATDEAYMKGFNEAKSKYENEIKEIKKQKETCQIELKNQFDKNRKYELDIRELQIKLKEAEPEQGLWAQAMIEEVNKLREKNKALKLALAESENNFMNKIKEFFNIKKQ